MATQTITSQIGTFTLEVIAVPSSVFGIDDIEKTTLLDHITDELVTSIEGVCQEILDMAPANAWDDVTAMPIELTRRVVGPDGLLFSCELKGEFIVNGPFNAFLELFDTTINMNFNHELKSHLTYEDPIQKLVSLLVGSLGADGDMIGDIMGLLRTGAPDVRTDETDDVPTGQYL